MKSHGLLILVVVLSLAGPLQAQSHTRRGAVVGGLTGAAAGAIIGDHNDEAGVGAAIGGAVGVLAGSVLGNSADQQNAYRQAARQQQWHYEMQRAVSTTDVLSLVRSGVSDLVIASTIQSHGIQRPLEVADIVHLSQNGVSDSVIQAMQHARVAGTASPVVARPIPPPYVSTRVYFHTPPPVYRVHPHHCPPPYYRGHRGPRW